MSYDPPRPAGRLLLTPQDEEAPPAPPGCAGSASAHAPSPPWTPSPTASPNSPAPPTRWSTSSASKGSSSRDSTSAPTPPRAGQARAGAPPAARLRLLPARRRTAPGARPGRRRRLPALRGQPHRRRVRRPLLPRRTARRQHGHGAGHGRRGGPRTEDLGETRAGDHQGRGRRPGGPHRGRRPGRAAVVAGCRRSGAPGVKRSCGGA